MEKQLIGHVTTGNVFDDLGFDPAESACLARKTDLMLELEHIIKKSKLSSHRAAKRFGVGDRVIDRLKSGDMDFFTSDMLMQMLEHAGKQVKVIVSDKKQISAA